MTSKHSAANRLLNTGLFDGIHSFTDIETRISALPGTQEIGDAFEIFAEAYLATQKITQAQQVWPLKATPLDKKKMHALDTGRDMGVDGTYLTIDGELRAYQAKFRSKRAPLTWEELSTFMGLTDQVSQRVLFTNSEVLPSLMQDRSNFVAIRGSDLDRLTTEDFEAMQQWLHTGQFKLPRKLPRPHQQEALTAIAKGLADNDRATVVMACGTGKSLVALWAAEHRDCKKLLVLVPSLALVRQLLHEWLRETAWDKFTFMCVCSDSTVAKGVDDLIVPPADLDFLVTTESAVVNQFLSKPFGGIKIVFSTYQSAHVVAEGMPVGADGILQPFDLGVFDEAHKTASRNGTKFSRTLEDAHLPIRKRLFFTATPRHYDVRKKDKEGDSTLVYSMDKPEIYGQVVHTLNFAEAVRREIICDYKVVISVMINEYSLKHGEVKVAGDTVKAKQVALQIALQKAVEKYGVSRIFTFHGSVAAARSFTSDDGEGIRQHLPDFTTLHVSGEMPTARREDQMKTFRQAEKAVMSNARCLTEGVDVPAVDMVAFISPRKSKVDIVQATGRAMRKSAGKEFGYVMVPLFVEQFANESIEEAVKRTGFDDVWDLLGAMKEQDDVLTDIIREMREDKGRTGGYDESRFRERVEVLGPSVSLETMRQSITAECIEKLGVTWDERYGELLEYMKSFCQVPQTNDQNSPQLASWVSNQRTLYNLGKMATSRIERLNKIGFVWDVLIAQWETMFARLLEFKGKEGHCRVPDRYSEDKALSGWVNTQRAENRKRQLSKEHKRRLEEIGFIWEVTPHVWEENFAALDSHMQKFGQSKVTDPKLQRWINKLREAYQKETLSSDQIQRLNNIGFNWMPMDGLWEAQYAKLEEFWQLNGHSDARERDDKNLASWVQEQRKDYKHQLSPDRIAKLNKIGLVWDARDGDWDEMFTLLLSYKQAHGDCNIPPAYKENPKLGSWVSTQRKDWQNQKISPVRQSRLEDIDFIWAPFEEKWNQSFKMLESYKNAQGHCNVPQKWKKNPSLGRWVSGQRTKWRENKLDSVKIQKLGALGFVWQPKQNK